MAHRNDPSRAEIQAADIKMAEQLRQLRAETFRLNLARTEAQKKAATPPPPPDVKA